MNFARETFIARSRVCIPWKQDLFMGCIALGFFLALFSFAGAQSAGGTETQQALQELGETTGIEVKTEEDAKNICNQEKYLSTCIDIGKKYNLYDENRRRQVDEFLEEAKDEVVGELRSCKTEECLLEAAKKLAEKIVKNKPELASELQLTPKEVGKKEALVKAARDAGISIAECRGMNPDTAPVELLRACAKVAKDSNIEGRIDEASIALREALSAGKYQCGSNTSEGCGNFCLNPGAEARAKGLAGIPAVCRQIATDFYGAEGIKALEAAYIEVEGVHKYFEEKKINKAFITQDGKTLYDPKEIGRYLEEQGQQGNMEAVAKGMDYLIQYGFAKPEDKEFALKFVENIRQRGKVVNFEECAKNPTACAEIIPEDVRVTFGKTEEARRIVSEEIQRRGVPDPLYCASEEYAERCLDASRSILPRIEQLAKQFPEVSQIAADLRKHVEGAGKELQARTKAKEELTRSGKLEIAGKEFSDWNELTEYCKTNGSLCLAEAAKQGFIEKDIAAEKYKTAFDIQYRAPVTQEGAFGNIEDFSFVSRYSPIDSETIGYQYQPTIGRATQPTLSSEKKEALLNEFKRWLENPVGAPPISGEIGRTAVPYPFQERQTGTSYYMSPEMERCLADRGVRGEAIDILRKGGSVSDTAIQRAGAECAKDIAAGKYGTKEPEVSVLPDGVESCLRAKGVREDDVRRMRRGEKVERYLEEVLRGCYGEAPSKEISKPIEEKEGVLKILTKPFQPIIKPIVGDYYLPDEEGSARFPYTFSDGFIANTRLEAETHCKEYPVGSGRGIESECEARIGVIMEGPRREYVNWTKHAWTFSDKSTESSYVLDRTDREYLDYIRTIENQCLKIQRYKFRWKEKAGDSTPENWKNFGIPDCSGTKIAEDRCYLQYGPGWIAKDDTKNCYDAYGPAFKTSEGKVYSCTAIPVGVSAPGCGKGTTEVAPRPIYGESPSDCSSAQYWDNNAKTCAVYTCPSGYAWNTAMRGCKNTKDASQICPPSTYWNTARNTCESLKCTPPQYWDDRSGSCKEPTTTMPVVPDNTYGGCGTYYSESSCKSQTNCSWAGTYCYYTGTGSVDGRNWKDKLWTFSNGTDMSSILNRTDKEYLDYIAGIETKCKTIKRENFCWLPGAGNQSDWQKFGIPDCSGTCSSGGTGGSGYQYAGDANSCPGFSYSTWDKTGKRYCRLNNSVSCQYNYPAYLTESNYTSVNCPTDGTASSTWSTSGGGGSSSCGSYTTQSSCTPVSGCSWAGTYCYYTSSGGGTGGSSSCSASLTALLGTGCHFMYNDSSGKATYCDGPMSKSAKEGDAATAAGCSSSGTSSGTGTTYAGDANSCPGFAYSTWDSTGKRYCKLNTKESCQYNYPSYLTESNYTATSCPSATSTPTSGGTCNYNGVCDGSETSASCGDCSYTGGTSCTPNSFNGNSSSPNTCSYTSCTSGCVYNSGGCATSCITPGTGGTGGTTTGGTCTYTTTETCVANSACRWMYPSGSTTGGWCESNSTTGGGSYGSGCSSYTTQSSCTPVSGCSWAGTYCYYTSSGGGTGGSSSCSTSLTALLGTGCHFMYNDSSGRATYCDTAMTMSAKEGDTATTAGCSGSSGSGTYGSSCPSGQYWNGSACVNTSTTDCPSGQYWNGTSCVSNTTSGTYSTGGTCTPNEFNGQTTGYACSYSRCSTGCTFNSQGCPSGCIAGGAYGGEKKGFAAVLDAVKKIFWTLSY